MMTRILTRRDVASVLTLEDCLTAVEEVFRRYGDGLIASPASLGVHGEQGTFHIKTAIDSVFATKINANFPDNPQRHGLPTIQGVIVVIDADRGTPLGILDSMLITTLRTAAATAVAAKYLARADASIVTNIGCGNQGRANLDALTRVRPITRCFAVDHDRDTVARFAYEMSHKLGIEVTTTESIDEAVAASDIVITCTTARSPILDARHRHPGLFIAGVGADNPAKNELSAKLLQQCLVVPDILEQAETMGDLHHAISAGLLTREDIHAELPQVICGRRPGRQNDDEVFIFDSTGNALQDVATASVALDRAIELGIGIEIDLAGAL